MTVEELIRELRKYPEDMKVFLIDSEEGLCHVSRVKLEDPRMWTTWKKPAVPFVSIL